ncbi:hypothetical protein ACHQM5_010174 [Ranunculus cassubicifolius]
MDPFSQNCEIVQLEDELDSGAQHFSIRKTTIEDDINKLFETIDRRSKARGLFPSSRLSTDSVRRSASKKPIRGGVSRAADIGISESVTLKQALRGLCISHASEVAAMKRLPKSMSGSSKLLEAGAIKTAVVTEADESGLPVNQGKETLVKISLTPEESQVASLKNIPVQALREESLSSSTTSSPQMIPETKESMIEDATEILRHTSSLKLGKDEEVRSAGSISTPAPSNRATQVDSDVSALKKAGNKKEMLKIRKNPKHDFSSSCNNSLSAVKMQIKSKRFFNKKREKETVTTCKSCIKCKADDNSGMSLRTSEIIDKTHLSNKNASKKSAPALCNRCLNVRVRFCSAIPRTNRSRFTLNGGSRRYMDTTSDYSESREPGDIFQSSKSSIGEFSNSTCVSEESHLYSFSHSDSRPHMSKDLRWDAIRHVEMEHGSLGMERFKMLKQLGCGDVGTVYLAELSGTNCLFAVKVIDTDSLGSKKMLRAQTERDILQLLDHPFLPTLFAHFTTNKFAILVLDYCPGGDLHILRQKQPGRTFTEMAARFYAAEILLALEYLHMLGIVYRDLKPENILVREDGHIMLSDFDLSLKCTVKPTLVAASTSTSLSTKNLSRPQIESSCSYPFCLQPSWIQVPCFTGGLLSTSKKVRTVAQIPQLLAEPTTARSNSFVGTHEYLAPEIIRGEGHGNAVDWWTFGIFLYELMFGTTPFKGSSNDETLANVVMHSIEFPGTSSVSSEAKDLIKGLLRKEPRDRFGSVKGAAEIRKHPFFEGLNWALIRCASPPVLPEACATGGLLLASKDGNRLDYDKNMKEHPEFEQF